MKNLKLLEHMEMEGHFEYNQTPLAPLVTKVCLVYWNIPWTLHMLEDIHHSNLGISDTRNCRFNLKQKKIAVVSSVEK